MSRAQHHPILSRFDATAGAGDATFRRDFLGVSTRWEFEREMLGEKLPVGAAPALPPFGEEYFEWIDVLEAVCEAKDHFTMIELGAGYGRWLVRAVAALRQVNPIPFSLVAVEAEPTHFLWLRQHLLDNGIDPDAHELVQAAVSARAGRVSFYVGNPSGWYGQAIAARARATLRGRLERLLGRRREDGPRVVRVPAVTLGSLLERHARVDLVDLDVQGAEVDALAPAIGALDRKVRRVHVGTHGPELEASLRELFAGHGWEKRNDYPCQASSPTPYGEIEFGDGVQTWTNPRL